jgi:hypothetical protein
MFCFKQVDGRAPEAQRVSALQHPVGDQASITHVFET